MTPASNPTNTEVARSNGSARPSLPSRVHRAVVDLRPYYVELLQSLVRIPSEIGEESRAQDLMEAEMLRLGLEVHRFQVEPARLSHRAGFNPNRWREPHDSPNLVGILKSRRGGGRSLILNAHIDTVPAGFPDDWQHSPYSGLYRDGCVYGRGAWDDKAGCVQLLWITEALQRSGVELGGDLVLQCVVEDETTANGTLACIDRGFVADGAVILDGTHSNGIIVAHMGQQMFELRFKGLPAPSVVPFRGHNPIRSASRMIELLERHQERKNDARSSAWGAATRPNFITVTSIRGGDGPSAVPGECVITGHFGFCPPQTVEQARAELRGLVAELADADPWLTENPPELLFRGYSCEPQGFEDDNPLLDHLYRVVEAANGEPPRRLYITGAGDLRHFVNPDTGERIPACMYGPGGGKGAHVANEYVVVDEVEKVARNVSTFLLEWCGVAEG